MVVAIAQEKEERGKEREKRMGMYLGIVTVYECLLLELFVA